jgi:hypothetical protein
LAEHYIAGSKGGIGKVDRRCWPHGAGRKRKRPREMYTPSEFSASADSAGDKVIDFVRAIIYLIQ